MENKFKIKPMLSFTPTKVKQNVYTIRARVGKKNTKLPHIEIRETPIQNSRGFSHSPRKSKPGMISLFKNAHRIRLAQTYLLDDKVYRLSKTNQSSMPHDSKSKDKKLSKPISFSKNNRSLSHQYIKVPTNNHGKVIQRTVSIVIDGKDQGLHNENDLYTTLSRIILGQQGGSDNFLIEFFDQSSIHGEQQNFVDMDSKFLSETVPLDQNDIVLV